MPRAIADSDDEDDDLFAEAGDVSVTALRSETMDKVNGKASVNNLEDTGDKSTGSTEHLRRQIESAERALLTNSASLTMPRDSLTSSDSPSVRATKRRGTFDNGAEPIASSERSVKRTKTTHTYGSKRSHTKQADDDVNFQRLFEDDAAPRTSQSARFTEHSGLLSSSALPPGSIREDFMDHEPNLMFGDSGSTVADTSSAQQRLLEQARSRKAEAEVSDEAHANKDAQLDSPMPWSSLGLSNATNDSKEQATKQVKAVGGHVERLHVADGISPPLISQNAPADISDNIAQTNGGLTDKIRTEISEDDSHTNITLSPIVEIPRDQPEPAKEDTTGPKKARLGRMRKPKEDKSVDSPVSDDRPVGLPAEQYKPRPSKRRAAPIDEEPIDYSTRLEKAAKAKKSRTASLENASGTEITESSKLSGTKMAETTDKAGIGTVTAEVPNRAQATATQNSIDNLDSGTAIPALTTTEQAKSSQPASGRGAEDEIVVVPPKSTQKPKAAAKPKRSPTTVFEDDVDLLGSAVVPDGGQQPTEGISALEDVQNEAKATQRKRKNVILDEEDEDEDDEAAEKPKDAEEETAPKKRGRGRPPKAAAKTQQEFFDNKTSEPNYNLENQTAEGTKKAPGRARAAKGTVDNTDRTSPVKQPSNKGGSTEPNGLSGSQNANAVIHRSSGELPTPSPEKQKTSQKEKRPEPASHTTTKGTSKVQYRVGLSQRARIPPLHRNIKPPKR